MRCCLALDTVYASKFENPNIYQIFATWSTYQPASFMAGIAAALSSREFSHRIILQLIFQERATNKMPSCAMLWQSNHPTLGGLDATHSHAASSTFVGENHHVRRLLAGKLTSHPSFCTAPAAPKDLGSCRFVKDIQPSKAHGSIFLTVSGMVKLVKELQPSKAPSPISVTECGMSNLVKELQPAKA